MHYINIASFSESKQSSTGVCRHMRAAVRVMRELRKLELRGFPAHPLYGQMFDVLERKHEQ